jgi:hypothetical protein
MGADRCTRNRRATEYGVQPVLPHKAGRVPARFGVPEAAGAGGRARLLRDVVGAGGARGGEKRAVAKEMLAPHTTKPARGKTRGKAANHTRLKPLPPQRDEKVRRHVNSLHAVQRSLGPTLQKGRACLARRKAARSLNHEGIDAFWQISAPHSSGCNYQHHSHGSERVSNRTLYDQSKGKSVRANRNATWREGKYS